MCQSKGRALRICIANRFNAAIIQNNNVPSKTSPNKTSPESKNAPGETGA